MRKTRLSIIVLVLVSLCLVSLSSCVFAVKQGSAYLQYHFINVNSFSDTNPSIPQLTHSNVNYPTQSGTYHVRWAYDSKTTWYLNYTIELDTDLVEPDDNYYTLTLFGNSGLYYFDCSKESPRNAVEENEVVSITNDRTFSSDSDEYEFIEHGSTSNNGVTISWDYGKIVNPDSSN